MDDSFHELEHAAPNRGGMPQVRPFLPRPLADDDIFLYRWSQQRQAFGKPLSSQAVIRSKLAQMIARVESAQSWLENVTHQMNNVRPPLPSHSIVLGGFSITYFPLCL